MTPGGIACQGKLDRFLHLTLFKPTLPYFRPNACAEAEAIHAKYFFSPVIVIIRLAAPGWVTDMPGRSPACGSGGPCNALENICTQLGDLSNSKIVQIVR